MGDGQYLLRVFYSNEPKPFLSNLCFFYVGGKGRCVFRGRARITRDHRSTGAGTDTGTDTGTGIHHLDR